MLLREIFTAILKQLKFVKFFSFWVDLIVRIDHSSKVETLNYLGFIYSMLNLKNVGNI